MGDWCNTVHVSKTYVVVNLDLFVSEFTLYFSWNFHTIFLNLINVLTARNPWSRSNQTEKERKKQRSWGFTLIIALISKTKVSRYFCLKVFNIFVPFDLSTLSLYQGSHGRWPFSALQGTFRCVWLLDSKLCPFFNLLVIFVSDLICPVRFNCSS